MSTTAIIAVIALVVAALSLLLQFFEWRRRREEIRLLREEAKRRDEEIALLRRQVGAEERAELEVFAGIQGTESEQGFEYTVGVQNTGASAASQIAVELVDGHGTTVGTSELIESLVPGQKAYATVVTPPRDQYTGPYEVYFQWNDGRSERNRAASSTATGAPSA